jgi:hypothetical protein
MTFRREIKLPFNGNVGRWYVYLVWGMRESGSSPELVAIATSETACKRYLKFARLKGFQHVRSETAWLDHAYGESIVARTCE